MTKLGSVAFAVLATIGLFQAGAAYAQSTAPSQIVVNASGGAQEEGLKRLLFSDYTTKFGTQVLSTSPVNFGKFRAMVDAGNPLWDLTEVSGFDVRRAISLNLAERLDETAIDRSRFTESARDPYVFGSGIFSTVFGYRIDAFPNGAPQSWADFWDVAKFPGPRSMRNHPAANLEAALLADGVAPDKLYPLDLDRAFKKLDQLNPHVTVWWTAGQQPPQMLIDKEVVLATGWTSRFYSAIRNSAPLKMEFSGGVMQTVSWMVPKGSKHKDAAMKLLAMYAEPERQAKLAIEFGSSGSNLDSRKYIPAEIAPLLPLSEANARRQVTLDEAWWEKHGADAILRWNKWMLSKR